MKCCVVFGRQGLESAKELEDRRAPALSPPGSTAKTDAAGTDEGGFRGFGESPKLYGLKSRFVGDVGDRHSGGMSGNRDFRPDLRCFRVADVDDGQAGPGSEAGDIAADRDARSSPLCSCGSDETGRQGSGNIDDFQPHGPGRDRASREIEHQTLPGTNPSLNVATRPRNQAYGSGASCTKPTRLPAPAQGEGREVSGGPEVRRAIDARKLVCEKWSVSGTRIVYDHGFLKPSGLQTPAVPITGGSVTCHDT